MNDSRTLLFNLDDDVKASEVSLMPLSKSKRTPIEREVRSFQTISRFVLIQLLEPI